MLEHGIGRELWKIPLHAMPIEIFPLIMRVDAENPAILCNSVFSVKVSVMQERHVERQHYTTLPRSIRSVQPHVVLIRRLPFRVVRLESELRIRPEERLPRHLAVDPIEPDGIDAVPEVEEPQRETVARRVGFERPANRGASPNL